MAGALQKAESSIQTGIDYISHIQLKWINRPLPQFFNALSMVLCEEKWSHGPQILKRPTQQARSKTKKRGISHLPQGSEVISETKFHKSAAGSSVKSKT